MNFSGNLIQIASGSLKFRGPYGSRGDNGYVQPDRLVKNNAVVRFPGVSSFFFDPVSWLHLSGFLKHDIFFGEPHFWHRLVSRVPERAEHHRYKGSRYLQDAGKLLRVKPSHRTGIKTQGFCTV